jgi:hypothetical protein
MVQKNCAFDSNSPVVLTPIQEKSAAHSLKARINEKIEMNKKKLTRKLVYPL